MQNQRVPILVYHHVYPDNAKELEAATFETGAGIIGATPFRRQMQFIMDDGWTVLSTTQIVDWLTGQAALAPKTLALHFDNGWLDTVTVALPILQTLGITATCFPITSGLESATQGQMTAVRTLTEGVIKKPFITWNQATQLLDAGWEVGAHTDSHCKMADHHAADGDEGVRAEAHRSNNLFVKHLGSIPSHFAYPSGSRNHRTDELLSGIYRSLRLWHFESPIQWTFTDRHTSPLAIDCQNIDLRVSFKEFRRLFDEAQTGC